MAGFSTFATGTAGSSSFFVLRRLAMPMAIWWSLVVSFGVPSGAEGRADREVLADGDEEREHTGRSPVEYLSAGLLCDGVRCLCWRIEVHEHGPTPP